MGALLRLCAVVASLCCFALAVADQDEQKCSCDEVSGMEGEMITPGEVEEAQKTWARDFLELSATCRDKDVSEATRAAADFVGRHYGFSVDGRAVIVRPPEVVLQPYRRTTVGVVSALVGDGDEFPEDVGFARRHWTKVHFENEGISVDGLQAWAMGSCIFTETVKEKKDKKDTEKETRIDYSMGFFRDPDGRLRLNVHFASAPFAKSSNETQDSDITPSQVEDAIKAWGESVVSIGQRYARHWDYQGRTNRFLETNMDYPSQYGEDDREAVQVLFKPPDAKGEQFRLTFEGARSYFIGDSKEFTEDAGFALHDWKAFDFQVEGVILRRDHAWAMGNYVFEDHGSWKSAGQFTFGFVRGRPGNLDPELESKLRINVLHLSFPHNGQAMDWRSQHEGKISVNLAAVEEAQQRWGKYLVQVGTKYRTAAQFVDNTYAYSIFPTFFKPAEAVRLPFRSSREGAISYFEGGNKAFSEDWGFATKTPWKVAHFVNEEVMIEPERATAVGSALFLGAGGVQRKVEFLSGYVQDRRGMLRLHLHHSSFPSPASLGKTLAFEDREPITREQVERYQSLWGAAVIDIGKEAHNITAARDRAKAFVDKMYGFAESPVLFKPTEADKDTRFRLTRLGTVSYFAGGDPSFPSDRGFARRPWVSVRFENKGLVIDGGQAVAMGQAFFADPAGVEVRLEHTINFFRDVDGRLRINVHHVSIPYDAKTNSTWDDLAVNLANGAGGFVDAAGQVGHVAASFNPALLLPIGFGVAVVLTLAYFLLAWDKHARNSPFVGSPTSGSWGAAGAFAGPPFASHQPDNWAAQKPGYAPYASSAQQDVYSTRRVAAPSVAPSGWQPGPPSGYGGHHATGLSQGDPMVRYLMAGS